MRGSIEVTPGSERSFGIVFTVVFALIAMYPLLSGGNVRLWAALIAVVLLATTFLRPSLLRAPNRWWFRLGLLLGAIIAPIVMGLVYLLAIVPTGLVMRAARRDLLNTKIDRDAETYWIERTTPLNPMKNQF